MSKIRDCRKKINISLGGKIIIVIIAAMLFCAVLWTIVLFFNITRNASDNTLSDERAYMQTVESNINKVEEVCNLAQRIVSQMYPVTDYIKLTMQGKDLESVNKINFYNQDIGAINNMIDTNPYLYQVRLFVNSNITERKPCFYNISRMDNMEWSKTYKSDQWQIDYYDAVFPESVNENIRLAGIVSQILDEDGNLLAVLEVSTKMENLFEDFYSTNEDSFCCFVEENGNIYCENERKNIWNDNKEEILKLIEENTSKSTSLEMKFNGQRSIVSTLYLPSLNGTFVHVRNTRNIINSYYVNQTPYVMVVIVSMTVFIVIVVILIRNIFKRFNKLTAAVNQIKEGEHIKLPEEGNDEISELGQRMNIMLSSLEKLNKENMNRQLLVKNTEIKALQNQINAHFMYNVLETIKMMAEIKEDYEISDAITSLGQMFRYSMKWTSGMVEIKEEISYIRKYLDLLNLRFDYEIYLSLNIPDKFMKLRIPKMSLQPLVENSVYHGIENVAEDTFIYIKVFENDDKINIEVSDAGVGMNEETLNALNERLNSTEAVDEQSEHGRALYNVQQRIKMYFGAEYGLKVFSEEGAYTKVLIQIPANKEVQE